MTSIVTRACFLLSLGASFTLLPALSDGTFAYDQAQAAKGGNGKGHSGNAGKGNAGGSHSANSAGKSKTNLASAGEKNKQKTKSTAKSKEMALTDPLAPAHPSMLGRWNAAKPITHPAIQAHIRKGKFNGTIGMIAAYAQAQTTYNGLEADLAVAEGVVKAGETAANLAAALTTANYADLAAYELAKVDPTKVDANIEALKAALAGQAVPTQAEIDAAKTVLAQGMLALSDLAEAEANMEAHSNRAPWGEIRDDVRARMELDPVENDLISVPVEEAAVPM